MDLQKALLDPVWINHKIGDIYNMINADSRKDPGVWKIAYYPLFGTYKNESWVEFDEPRVLIEKEIKGGTDFREVPLRYISKTTKT